MLAVTALDVAFVSAIVAGLSAVAAPLSAWLIATANHRQQRWERAYEDVADAYRHILRTMQLNIAHAEGFSQALAKNDPSTYESFAATQESAHERVTRLAVVNAVASENVRKQLALWRPKLDSLYEALGAAKWGTEDERKASRVAIEQQLKPAKDALTDVARAIRAELRPD